MNACGSRAKIHSIGSAPMTPPAASKDAFFIRQRHAVSCGTNKLTLRKPSASGAKLSLVPIAHESRRPPAKHHRAEFTCPSARQRQSSATIANRVESGWFHARQQL